MLFGWDNNIPPKEINVSQGLNHPSIEHNSEIQRPQPILFQNLDLSPRASGGSCNLTSFNETGTKWEICS
ncbi:hypothetical protein Leryth_027467 [Lithospermum erythrorhizon]|nr:hypothetical protein Leryth_027467 [Lithospermum erythrorhizon]